MSAALERRAAAIRARALQRQWTYRQRDTSQGVWTRVGRVLAMAAELWAIPPAEAARLIAEGYSPDGAGEELDPPKTILLVPRARLVTIEGRRPLPLTLGPPFLAARTLVAVAFDDDARG